MLLYILGTVSFILFCSSAYFGKKYIDIKRQLEDFSSSYQDKYIDSLTHITNRQGMIHYLQNKIENEKNEKFTLVLLDLDNFKHTNDTLGHKIGDQIIQEVSNRLKGLSDFYDMFLAHAGGDTFFIAFHNCQDSRTAREAAETIQRKIAEKIFIAGKELLLTASIGIVLYPEFGEDAQMLMKNVDIALYKSKAQRNTYSFYTYDMEADAKKNAEILTEMRRALERKEFVLYYQPKINVKTGKVVSSEALVRWKHPEKGIVGPGYFIELAEKSGLIVPIGDLIIDQACKDTQNLRNLTEELKDISVAINLSGYQFDTGDVAGLIARVIWEYKLDHNAIELELTESVVMDNPDKALLMLKVLKTMNIKIAIDDFGTGHSSLSYLRKFPIDTLKIDQAFVRNLHEDEDDAAIVSIILNLAKQLKLKVVAEGVENKEQYEFLKERECDLIQGYYFSKPVPFETYKNILLGKEQLDNQPY